MTSKVTIYDIAQAAGVSTQTVTRAMNGMPRISEETRARVLRISEELGYRPSRFASNLARTTPTKTIAFVVDSFRNPYYSELTADLLDTAAEREWQVTVSSHESEPVLDLVTRLAGQVDAIVGYLGDIDETKLAAASRGIPVVLLGRDTPTGAGLFSVDLDFDAGLHDAVVELRARGSQRFAMLESQSLGHDYVPSPRRRAYEASVDQASAASVIVCEAGPQSVDAGETGMRRLLRDYPETDTVIAFSDLMAMGALRATHALGIDVPGGIRVVGIDGLSLGAVTSPALSSLAIVGDEFTRHIAEVVQGAFDGKPATELRRTANLRMLWRESA